MDAGEIRVDTEALTELEGHISQVVSNVFGGIDASLVGAPDVEAKYDELAKKWDERRDNLFAALQDLESKIRKIRESFEDNDASLAAELQVSGGTK